MRSIALAQSPIAMNPPCIQFLIMMRLLTFLVLIECANSSQCAPMKHHFDECVERVTRQQEDPDAKGPKEDCVEECKEIPFLLSLSIVSLTWILIHSLLSVFHLQHCATQCAAPKLFRELK